MTSPDSRLPHGALKFPEFTIESYSLALRDENGLVGDSASRPAFQSILEAWRTLFEVLHGKDPLGNKPSEEISKKKLADMLADKGPAAAAIHAALEDYSEQLIRVIRRFLRHESWKGVQRIIIGGGLKQSEIGAHAIETVAKRLFHDDIHVQLRLLHHHADEGGLVGWLHLMPADIAERYRAMLAVDIGGTNIRCGIVRLPQSRDPRKAKVVISEKWSHGRDEDTTRREHVVQGIADMLIEQIAYAKKKKIKLAPWIGVACPGRIRQDGSISRGTQNLPGDWAHPNFHLPRALCKRLPLIDGQETKVVVHNDAVVQGLSELPYVDEIRRWGVLTIGTGVGNACYTMRRKRGSQEAEETREAEETESGKPLKVEKATLMTMALPSTKAAKQNKTVASKKDAKSGKSAPAKRSANSRVSTPSRKSAAAKTSGAANSGKLARKTGS